jgi:hypothetical protein
MEKDILNRFFSQPAVAKNRQHQGERRRSMVVVQLAKRLCVTTHNSRHQRGITRLIGRQKEHT